MSISSVGKFLSLVLLSSKFPLLSSSTLESVNCLMAILLLLSFLLESLHQFLLLFLPSFLALSPTGGINPGRGWLELALFLLLFDFPFPPFTPFPSVTSFSSVTPFPPLPLLRPILPYLYILLLSVLPNNPIIDPCHRGCV